MKITTTQVDQLAEFIRDTIGAALVAGAGVTITVNDAGDTITLASSVTQYTDEQVRDVIGAALVAGTGMTITVNDGADTITLASSGGGGSYTDEQVRDVIGAALVAGTGITITVNDAGDTITVAAAASGLTYSDIVLLDRPVAFWPLDDSAGPFIDHAGQHDATLTGTLPTTGAALVSSYARSPVFAPASTPLLSAADRLDLSPIAERSTQMTLEAVLRPTTMPATSCTFLSKAASAGGSNYEYGIVFTSTGVVAATVWGPGGAGNLTATSAAGAIVVNTTTHVAVVVDLTARLMKILINGVQNSAITTDAAASGYGDGNSAVTIGRRGDGAGDYFTGRMQAVAIHSRALSAKRLLARVPFLV